MAEATRPPRPYLTREDQELVLIALGFEFNPGTGQLKDTPTQRAMFSALQTLLAGAIVEWADVEEPEKEEGGWEGLVQELEDWTEEWLVG